MRITARGITVECHTTQDVKDVCAVLGTGQWSEAEIAMFEHLIEQGKSSAEAMRLVDQAKQRRAS